VPAEFRLTGLYAVTPEGLETDRLLHAVAAAVEGGARAVQYRSKQGSRKLHLEQGAALVALCRRHRVPLIVNDDVEVASLIDADGVHLGRDDDTIAAARGILGLGKIIGVSCYDRFELAREAQSAGADYVAFGSFFPSRIKPDAPRPPLDLLSRARRSLALPIAAIGGINATNARLVIEAGAHAIATITAVFADSDPRAASAELTRLFDKEDLLT